MSPLYRIEMPEHFQEWLAGIKYRNKASFTESREGRKAVRGMLRVLPTLKECFLLANHLSCCQGDQQDQKIQIQIDDTPGKAKSERPLPVHLP